ncbi:helix-turn-helix transcriptional regulator [Methylorubrum extorquens]|jgi:DNA-binding CsgD family transcriptional regulator|uniref:helix-turn-helix transcriptional regulator n=1 Tax=Methylorubrum extorquens TaxID=408 RepID=UPI001AE9C51C|nr:helix-turn-helix transcriptional regulator [Methylorubrum extorquens]MDF9861345.1 DNA-binding CsgD family transcriptional regulator [Methylorubrum pseudosasae]MDH6634973.1 DNA-binding CsgD family transcriptional regulator [Methylobacterium sp. SuP10 SLI 274]MDH6664143.1 DNA-binding CsgD family transcriptional regulator [Methylorubrum zatmanii]MCP1535491.1 DNA-binding CsgD family transcriptional regulator [Methylorubrum extorquens]MCP1561148.1 DNA-binding CsgD family transcriptional regulato
MPGPDDSLIDTIYEAAHIPELWPVLLDRLSELTDAWGGMLFTATPEATRWVASPQTTDFFAQFLGAGWMAKNPLVERGVRRNHAGFLTDLDLFTHCELDAEPMYDYMRRIGGGWHLGTAITVPNGDTLVVNIERRHTQGAFLREQAEQLDLYRPHLARAALLAARYTQNRYETAVGDLEALGLAAAAVSLRGSLIACNARFQALMPALVQDGPSGLIVSHQPAQAQVQTYLARTRLAADIIPGASIPIPAALERGPAILHLVPVNGAARDIFARTACLVVVTTAEPGCLPSSELVQGLFDLTPAEARVARDIARGLGVPEAAVQAGVTQGTIRSQLKAVFAKTGTSRQAELAALLNGISPLRPSDSDEMS